MTASFALDSRLAADTATVAELALSRAVLMDDARFPWLILVPRRAAMTELVDLGDADLALLTVEIRLASAALRTLFAPDKLNVAAIGNIVPQLHVHVVARKHGDAAWPGPVWGFGIREPYEAARRADLVQRLTQQLVPIRSDRNKRLSF